MQQPASLDFIYVDDRGRHPLHYVASGIPRTHRLIEPLYNVPDTTIRGKHPERRAQLLSWILEQPFALDLNAVDMRCALGVPHPFALTSLTAYELEFVECVKFDAVFHYRI